jgi:hypothetical protein
MVKSDRPKPSSRVAVRKDRKKKTMKTNKQNKRNSKTNEELLSRSEQVSETSLDPRPSTPAFHETAPAGPWRGVFFDGPEPEQDHEGEEIPVWTVYVGDEEAEPTGTVYHVYNFRRAHALAERMAGDRRLELINEATNA